MIGLFERDRHVVLKVRPPAGLGPRAAAPTTKGRAKHLFKDIAKAVKASRSSTAPKGIAATALFKGCVTKLVVGCSLLRIFQRVVGLVDLLEGLFGCLVALVPVWVVLHGQLTKSRLELLLRCGFGDAQNLVVIAF